MHVKRGRPKQEDKLVIVGVTVSKELSELLSQLATERGLSVAKLCRQFILLGLLEETGNCTCQEVNSE